MDSSYKVVIMGSANSGKSSVLARYIDPDTEFNRDRSPTVGVDFKTKKEKTKHMFSKDVKLSLWDTSGQERFKSVVTAYMNRMDCAIIIFDLTNKKSFDSVVEWIDMVKENCSNPLIYIVGCKADSKNRSVNPVDISNLAHSYKVKYFETSSLKKIGIEPLFRNIATDCYDARKSIRFCNVS